MESHRNDDHLHTQMAELFFARNEATKRLQAEAEEAKRTGASAITGGTSGEEPLREWEKYGVFMREFPVRENDEALNLVRISIGGSFTENMAYCVYRGSTKEVRDLLTRALNALRYAP